MARDFSPSNTRYIYHNIYQSAKKTQAYWYLPTKYIHTKYQSAILHLNSKTQIKFTLLLIFCSCNRPPRFSKHLMMMTCHKFLTIMPLIKVLWITHSIIMKCQRFVRSIYALAFSHQILNDLSPSPAFVDAPAAVCINPRVLLVDRDARRRHAAGKVRGWPAVSHRTGISSHLNKYIWNLICIYIFK